MSKSYVEVSRLFGMCAGVRAVPVPKANLLTGIVLEMCRGLSSGSLGTLQEGTSNECRLLFVWFLVTPRCHKQLAAPI